MSIILEAMKKAGLVTNDDIANHEKKQKELRQTQIQLIQELKEQRKSLRDDDIMISSMKKDGDKKKEIDNLYRSISRKRKIRQKLYKDLEAIDKEIGRCKERGRS